MKRLAVDIDDTILETPRSMDAYDAYWSRHNNTMFLPPMSDAQSVLAEIARAGVEIVYLSSRHPSMAEETHAWLNMHRFPHLDNMLLVGNIPSADSDEAAETKVRAAFKMRVSALVDDELSVCLASAASGIQSFWRSGLDDAPYEIPHLVHPWSSWKDLRDPLIRWALN